MRVQAFEAAAARRAADPDGKLGPQPPLLSVRLLQAGRQIRVMLRPFGPPLDAARGLYPRERGNKVRAGQPEGGRERLAVLVVGRLLGDGRTAERAADSYAAERSRRTPQLSLDHGTVIHYRPRLDGSAVSVPLQPAVDALDDEEPLSRLDQPEPPRFARELRVAR
jgi:hypothetical protein